MTGQRMADVWAQIAANRINELLARIDALEAENARLRNGQPVEIEIQNPPHLLPWCDHCAERHDPSIKCDEQAHSEALWEFRQANEPIPTRGNAR